MDRTKLKVCGGDAARGGARCAARLAGLVAGLVLLAACDDADRGLREYRDGHFADAHRAFAAAADAAGDDAPAELLYDRALAALRDGAPQEAEDAAKAAMAKAGASDPETAALAAFVLGNASFARCELAALQAAAPEAEPFAWDVAIRRGQAARDAWAAAAATRDDWPEARRNVERALLRIEELRRLKAQAEQRRLRAGRPNVRPGAAPSTTPAPGNPPPPLPPAPDATAGDGRDDRPGQGPGELSPAEVARLLELLAQKEKEKVTLRRAHRDTQGGAVERDW